MKHCAFLCLLLAAVSTVAAADDSPAARLLAGKFSWKASEPLISAATRPEDPCHAIKDPTIVRHGDRWHVFATIRSAKRTHQIEYVSFADWKEADRAERHLLTIVDKYFCAPQVFYFTPHKKWYLIFQASDPTRKPQLQPAFATTDTIGDPKSWSKPQWLYEAGPKVERWIDFWVICDERQAHLFFTSLDGKMWRSSAPKEKFPHGWDEPRVVLTGDIFEASHTYQLAGLKKYLTLVEAQGGGRRYYKAYLADRLDGDWQPLADSLAHPFAAPGNVRFAADKWSDSFSHGELLRSGNDETLPVDPNRLQFLFQGVLDKDMAGKPYGQIPWRLGLLELSSEGGKN